MSGYFDGYYLKHQKGENTLSLIVGKTDSEKFIQVITREFSMKVPFTPGNVFSKEGVILDIHTPELTLTGNIRYGELAPICYDIMGPFALFPMECRHGILSMSHTLEGSVCLNGTPIDFTGGKGYLEKDSGRSFPFSYVWIQANDFDREASIMAAVADIPFCGRRFQGCICVIHFQGKEYRLATYLGVKVLLCTEKRILLKQGKYRLDIRVNGKGGLCLSAPQNGKMARTIREAVSVPAEFVLWEKNRKVFDLFTKHASFEYENRFGAMRKFGMTRKGEFSWKLGSSDKDREDRTCTNPYGQTLVK